MLVHHNDLCISCFTPKHNNLFCFEQVLGAEGAPDVEHLQELHAGNFLRYPSVMTVEFEFI